MRSPGSTRTARVPPGRPGANSTASEEEPQYEVEGDWSGRSAVHKPGALRKRRDGS